MIDIRVELKTEQKTFSNFLHNMKCSFVPITTFWMSIPADINLADRHFGIPTQIDLLIGADVYYDITYAERFKLGQKLLQKFFFVGY